MSHATMHSIIVLTLPLCLNSAVQADILDFEDVATPYTSLLLSAGEVTDGYRGFDWQSNWSAYPGGSVYAYMNSGTVPSGYQSAIASGTRALYTPANFGQPLCILTITRGEIWNFSSVDIGTAWRTGVFVEITGSLAGSTLYSHSFTIDSAGVLGTLALDFSGIDTLTVRSSGGVAAYADGDGAHLIMDNLNYSVPAPGALALLALAGGVRRRRR